MIKHKINYLLAFSINTSSDRISQYFFDHFSRYAGTSSVFFFSGCLPWHTKLLSCTFASRFTLFWEKTLKIICCKNQNRSAHKLRLSKCSVKANGRRARISTGEKSSEKNGLDEILRLHAFYQSGILVLSFLDSMQGLFDIMGKVLWHYWERFGRLDSNETSYLLCLIRLPSIHQCFRQKFLLQKQK